MKPLLLAALPLALWLARATSQNVQITVDASQPDASVPTQVTYRRGEDLEFDQAAPPNTPSEIVAFLQRDVKNFQINLVTASYTLSSDSDETYFDYSAGPPRSLTPSVSGSSKLIQTFGELRSSLNATELPAVIQISGTPSALPSGMLNPKYQFLCNGSGNFFPLPRPGRPKHQVQNAIGDWIKAVGENITGAIWIGFQEPTHTCGFSRAYDTTNQNCSPANHTEIEAGVQKNIGRFVSFWTPIAHTIRKAHMKSGAIQANEADASDYALAAQRIIAAGMPLDYFTIQNYKPSLTVVQDAHAALQQLQAHPAYQHVQVLMDRYALSDEYSYADAQGMTQYLIAESYLMQYAEMMYGYAVEESGLHSPGTLLPTVFTWLQDAPQPLRPLTSSSPGFGGFALIQTSASASGRIAIWNNGNSSQEDVSVTVDGYPQSLSSTKVTILHGSGQAISNYTSPTLSINSTSINALSLAPNEFFLISF